MCNSFLPPCKNYWSRLCWNFFFVLCAYQTDYLALVIPVSTCHCNWKRKRLFFHSGYCIIPLSQGGWRSALGISSSSETNLFTTLVFPTHIELGSKETSENGVCRERCNVHHPSRWEITIFRILCSVCTQHTGVMIHLGVIIHTRQNIHFYNPGTNSWSKWGRVDELTLAFL